MTRRAFAAAAAAAAMVLLATSSAAAVTDSSMSVQAPKTVKPGKTIALTAVVIFDARLHNPPYTYLKAGVWQHRGDDRCLKAVPVDRAGWKELIHHDFYPDVDSSDGSPLELSASVRLKKTGTYRWCGYIYTVESDSYLSETYHPVVRAQARTSVRR
jgi:hypothetical protein